MADVIHFDLPQFYLVFSCLFLGALVGWQLALWVERRQRHESASAWKSRPQQPVEEGQAPDLAPLETQIAELDRKIAEARRQVQQRDDEYATLILELDSQQALLDETRADRRRPAVSAPTPADTLVRSIDADQQEIDLLTQIHEGNRLKINKLTQSLQWQDSELQLQREATARKEIELQEARDLTEQREAELRRVIRQRKQREQDLAHAAAELEQVEQTLQEAAVRRAPSMPPAASPLSAAAPEPRVLTPAPAFQRSDCAPRPPEWEDDLSQIAGLLPFYADQLKAQGVRSFCDLACLSPQQLEGLLKIPGHYSPDLPAWIASARSLARQESS